MNLVWSAWLAHDLFCRWPLKEMALFNFWVVLRVNRGRSSLHREAQKMAENKQSTPSKEKNSDENPKSEANADKAEFKLGDLVW